MGDGFVGPVVLIDGALLDPAFEEGALREGERRFVRVGRRHHLVGIGAEDALPRLGVREIAGRDGAHAAAVGGGGVGLVEAELGLAMRGVGAVTRETVVGENGTDVGVEGDGGLGGGGAQSNGGCEGAEGEQQTGFHRGSGVPLAGAERTQTTTSVARRASGLGDAGENFGAGATARRRALTTEPPA